MRKKAILSAVRSIGAALLTAAAPALMAQGTSVLTAGYDNNRTGVNNSEVILNPSDVNVSSFGRIGTYRLDGIVAGQPLYLSAVLGGKTYNVIYVATMNNSVYALNADQPGSAPYWKVNLGPAVPVNYAGACPAGFATGTQLGILSTPVIDPGSRTIYVVAATPVAGSQAYIHTLYALDLATGALKNGGSVVMAAAVSGTGDGSQNGVVTLGQTNMIQRPALLLSSGNVYAGFSGCGPDPDPYHGWVLGYQGGNIKNQVAVFNSTPNGGEGGIWQSGRGLVGDPLGNIYFETGNGTSDNMTELGESFVAMSPTGAVLQHFTPSNVQALSALDMDLSTAPILTPDTYQLIGGGKEGTIYVLGLPGPGQAGLLRQAFPGAVPCPVVVAGGCQRIHSLAYWANARASKLYVWSSFDFLRSYSYQNGAFSTAPDSIGSTIAFYPGGLLSVSSAYGDPSTGIVWALTPGELHAFAATNVANELWNSAQNAGRDAIPGNYHFAQFLVANGKVFVPDSANNLVVYGLLH